MSISEILHFLGEIGCPKVGKDDLVTNDEFVRLIAAVVKHLLADPVTDDREIREACDFLGVKANATKAEIKKAYRKKAFEFHPDSGGTNDQMIKLYKARDILLSAISNNS